VTIALDNATPCVKFASLFQNPLLEDETSVETAADIRTQAALTAHAAKLCGECPLRAQCLTDAVVSYDVAGFVAGTTEPQRREIRVRLGVTVVIITHEMSVVRQVCDSVSLLEAGQIVESGRLEDIVLDVDSRLSREIVPFPKVPEATRWSTSEPPVGAVGL